MVLWNHLSYIRCTHGKKEPEFKVTERSPMARHSQRWRQPEKEKSKLYNSVHSSREDFHDLLYSAVTQATPCNTSIKGISVVLLCNGQRCFLSILRSLQDTPFMLSTPLKPFQQIMKPIRDKWQHTNLLNSNKNNIWARHFPSCFLSTSYHAELTATHRSCNMRQGCSISRQLH